ncbi:hypothetical protein G6F55_014120 [Rhizopus delemar]|nr:hypothetical protein G6F55_014120 [Rhizopus delemar]
MTGSETFIIVAFRCTENSTPVARASSSWACRKDFSLAVDSTAASMISPALTGGFSFSTVFVPSAAVSSILTSPASAIRADFSVP